MKNAFLISCVLYSLMGCNNHNLSHKEIVTNYYKAFDSGDYVEIKELINDSISIISGDYATSYNHEKFYDFFKWDSIFKSSYEMVDLEEKDGHVFATIAQDNFRNEFLKSNPLVFKVEILFDSEKISEIKELEYLDVNWDIWNKEKDSLVSWIKNNHPNLDGFVHDMTMDGAANYLRAIELYKTRLDSSVYEMWNSFIESNPEFSEEQIPESWYFHNNKKDANRLAELTLNGKKKASSGLYLWYEEAGANLPKIGTKHIVTDFDGKARAIIEIKRVDTIPFNQISEEYAEMDMGTNSDALKKWKQAHWEFFASTMEESSVKPTEEILVVCERFETIWAQKEDSIQ